MTDTKPKRPLVFRFSWLPRCLSDCNSVCGLYWMERQVRERQEHFRRFEDDEDNYLLMSLRGEEPKPPFIWVLLVRTTAGQDQP